MDISKIQNLKNQAISSILEAKSKQELEELRVCFLGRKGTISRLIKELPKLEVEERKEIGNLLNDAKAAVEQAISHQQSAISHQPLTSKDWLDVTAPGEKLDQGHLHPLTKAIREISAVFERIGFIRVSYPEVEWEWYAFDGLNMPKSHPARDDYESFFIENKPSSKYGRLVITPHTSSGQLREMQRTKPPIRIINIARCGRPNWDLTHTPTLHQFEGLVIDKGINVTHLKGVFDYFAINFFGPKRKIRLRPFHFQFTEPSFEVDIDCPLCLGKGCKICKGGWHELGGSGMVHPKVLKNGGVDPKKYSGFAFGWGVERSYAMKLGLDDIRPLYEPDLRFINQF